MTCNCLNIGDRVYYTANGSDDTGTISYVDMGSVRKYGVTWDADPTDDVYLRFQLTKI